MTDQTRTAAEQPIHYRAPGISHPSAACNGQGISYLTQAGRDLQLTTDRAKVTCDACKAQQPIADQPQPAGRD